MPQTGLGQLGRCRFGVRCQDSGSQVSGLLVGQGSRETVAAALGCRARGLAGRAVNRVVPPLRQVHVLFRKIIHVAVDLAPVAVSEVHKRAVDDESTGAKRARSFGRDHKAGQGGVGVKVADHVDPLRLVAALARAWK